MFTITETLKANRAMMELAMAYQAMTIAAGEVILRRTFQMATGAMSPPDAAAMILEKGSVFALAAEKAVVAAAKGGDPVRVARAALHPYGVKTKANVRRLRR